MGGPTGGQFRGRSRLVRLDGFLSPLLDPDTGKPYEYVPCQDDPASWDDDAPLDRQREAARRCKAECPALKPCRERRKQLGGRATGVWAGLISRASQSGSGRVRTEIFDPELATWAESAGVTIPADRRKAAEQ